MAVKAKRVSRKFGNDTYFRAKANLTRAEAKSAVHLLSGIHHTRTTTQPSGKKSVWIMDKEERNTY